MRADTAVLFVAIVVTVASAGPARAALGPESPVLRRELTNVTAEALDDLTTAPQRATNSVHPDAVTMAGKLPNLELIQPHAHRAFELLEAWVEQRIPAPPSQCVPRGGSIVETPAETACADLLVP